MRASEMPLCGDVSCTCADGVALQLWELQQLNGLRSALGGRRPITFAEHVADPEAWKRP